MEYRLSNRCGQGGDGGVVHAGGQEVPTLSYWCFEPGVAMAALCALKVRSILLTSGTLAPLDSFAQELSLDFPVTLENPHVVNTSQVRLHSLLSSLPTHQLLSTALALMLFITLSFALPTLK